MQIVRIGAMNIRDINELPWPKKGDVLFSEESSDLNTTACFLKACGAIYATGYKRAADIFSCHT